MPEDRILVTGGTGFVGRHVMRRLLALGRQLTLVVLDGVPVPQPWLDDGRVRVVVADLARSDLGPAIADATTIVHIAGLPAMPRGDDAQRRLEDANVVATDRLASAAAAGGARQFIHVSSIRALVGNSADEPISDASDLRPDGAYGRSKRAAEERVAELAHAGCFAVSLRPPLVIGSDAAGNWHSLQRLAATGLPLPFASVTAKRSYIAVDSLAAAIVRLCAGEWSADKSGAYCVADPDALSLPDVLSELRRGMGLPSRLFPFPAAGFRALGRVTGRQREVASLVGPLEVDASRFSATFGFEPPQPLGAAIRQSGAEFLAASRRGTTAD